MCRKPTAETADRTAKSQRFQSAFNEQQVLVPGERRKKDELVLNSSPKHVR
ncbi:hypothetical protein SynA1562_02045 [Synechococcus sp. A15-62]|nr:hypothetical protein SynA1562_02045 [Synechococcus sp. A15-62]